MNTGSRTGCARSLSLPFVIALLYCLTSAITSLNLFADGCFVAPKFVWDKHKDINEPTQKAIIVHEAGHEELLLQVRYDGPLEEFGWLIPVPDVPTVKKGSMECFYELSQFTQKNLEWYASAATLSAKGGGEEEEPPVKVIEVKTVGAYEIAVLSTKTSGALETWLKKNQFAFPPNADGVVDTYVKRGWYFIAVKINVKGGSLYSTSRRLASGELHPLQISFASERCVFPLKISSLNRTPSEVQVYVLSPEPLVERKLFEKDLAANYSWRTNLQARWAESLNHIRSMRANSLASMGRRPDLESDHQLGRRSEINTEKLGLYAAVGRKAIPVCTREMALLKKEQDVWLLKQTWTFQPEEMRDLEFEPAVPVFAAALADSEGAFAAANLLRLRTNGISALISAIKSTNSAVRAHAMSVAENMFVVSSGHRGFDEDEDYPRRRAMNPELLKLLPALLNDPDPEVRLHAVYAAGNSHSPAFFDVMLQLLRDDYAEINEAAQGYLRQQPGELHEHVPLLRQMLKDTNASVQIAGLRLLMSIPDVSIPRDEVLPLFSVPRMDVAGAAVAYLRNKSISGEEAKPLLQNSLGMVRMMGLAILSVNANNQSVELAIPLLKDPEPTIRLRACNLLTDLTGQNFPAEAFEQWEKWWGQNRATFKVSISPQELRQKQLERARQRRRPEGSLPP